MSIPDTKLQYVEGNPPASFKKDYEISLFNSQTYQQLQRQSGWKSYHVVRKDRKKILASVFFFVEEAKAWSPWRAPFGSFELSDKITTQELFDFVSFIEKKLKDQGVRQVSIKSYPEQYHSSHHSLISVVLFNHGYKIINAELGACIDVNEMSLASKMDSWEKRKLNQGIKEGLMFNYLDSKKLKQVYDFILECRQAKGYILSMTWEELQNTVKNLKHSFKLFGVFLKGELVAASISVRINNRVLYNFYSAHHPQYNRISPVVFLINSMYKWCYDHKMNLLDLGTSAMGGIPNFPLIDFKLRLGAHPAMKLTFEKRLKS